MSAVISCQSLVVSQGTKNPAPTLAPGQSVLFGGLGERFLVTIVTQPKNWRLKGVAWLR
jgi:hypothetical protein